MMKILTALTLTVPFLVIADTTYEPYAKNLVIGTTYESCADKTAPIEEFYHAKYVGLFDKYAKDLHDSSKKKLEALAQNFTSEKVYMTALQELVENDPKVAAKILDQKMKKKEKPFDVLLDFEKEHGGPAHKKNGQGASIRWTGDRELVVELCDVWDNIGDIEMKGKASVQVGIRVCTHLTFELKQMPSGGYSYSHKFNERYNLEPIPDRKVVLGDQVTLFRTVDQYRGVPIMPKAEFVAFRVEKTCGKKPKNEKAMINFSERGNEKADKNYNPFQTKPNNKGLPQ